MTRTPKSGRWPPYPHIPIYLEASDGNGTTKTYNTISPISPYPELHTPKWAIYSLAAASTRLTNISPVSPATQFTNLSPIWPIPEPAPEISQQPPKRPALRFFPSRPRLQLEGVPLEQAERQEVEDPYLGRESKFGLGIQDAPSTPVLNPTLSPDDEKGKRSSNIAQRIEEGLWRYSLSGNVIKRWLLEIISWWLSAIRMAAIIGVLIFYRDKKIPNWPGSFTLNAFIATLEDIWSCTYLAGI